MIRGALPPGVVAAVSHDDGHEPGEELFPQEEALIRRAVPKRQREFTTVRFLARRALRELGRPPVALLPDPRGAPRWPEGIVGSMTHCDGYRAAAVARAEDTLGLGIDAEPNAPLPDGVLEAIALPREHESIASLAALRPEVNWDRLLFSAKESVFKVWYPLTGRELDFSEAEIVFAPAGRTFRARLLVPGPVVQGRSLGGFDGCWTRERGLLATAIHLPRLPAPDLRGAQHRPKPPPAP
ncbi:MULTISPECIES: 4'-phosphopantetheinyl transferase [unclassified Streptomyces]|uniref:4'-phosphopantetheinyl transferase family protein n=1 Tax=unclassified Streptomyces TaxID=2593676 RepID=UPI0035ABBDA2